MYHGEGVCLSHVGDFRGECISGTASTAGPLLFYFGKKKYTSQAVCTGVIQMWMVFQCLSWYCCKSLARELVMYATSAQVREKKDRGGWISFFICFCYIIMTMSLASRHPSQMRLVVSEERDVLCCRARLCLNARTPPSPVIVSQQDLRCGGSYMSHDA